MKVEVEGGGEEEKEVGGNGVGRSLLVERVVGEVHRHVAHVPGGGSLVPGT